MGLPVGSRVTFLFTDIEGSTRVEQAVGSERWAALVAEHDDVLREAIEGAGGHVVKTEGDAFFAAFDEPEAAIAGIARAQRALAGHAWPREAPIRVRAGLHLGEGRLRYRKSEADPEDYVGIDVNYAARIANAANGGQVVVSEALVGALGPDAVEGAGASLVDEGLRRVKDFDEPARLYRLVIANAADDDRRLRTLDAPTNLPTEATPMIGRERELEEIRAALRDSRVVTLTGPGGSGKTRLAIATAQSIRDRFPHGTFFVDLAAVEDPALLEPSITAAIGLRDVSAQATDAALRAYLADREVLLVLDNLEQLLPDAATRIAALVRAAGRSRVLATTRELLRISGELGYTVPALEETAGAALFEDRARRLRPDLALSETDRRTIREISARLGGLPLAIELAAARVRLMPLDAILQRVGRALDLGGGARDAPERQRTLRGALAWSHDLLSDPERKLFRRLGVFVGGWSVESAMAVVEPDELGVDLVGGLESLLDKSLVRLDADADGRFSMHPLLHEYALERLDETAERPALEARAASYFVELAEALQGSMLGDQAAASLRQLDLEQHNIRAAIDRAVRAGDLATAMRLASATWRWFQQRGRLREGREVLDRLLDHPASTDDPRLRITALDADGGLAYWMDDREGAADRYQEQLALAEAIGDPKLEAAAHYNVAFTYMVAGDVGSVREHATRAVQLYESIGDDVGARRAEQTLSLGDFLAGEYATVIEREERRVAASRAAGQSFAIADTSTLLSAAYYRAGDGALAWERLVEGLGIFSTFDLASGVARALAMAALLQLEIGDEELGARLAGATAELARTKHVMVAPTKVLHLPDAADVARARLGDERASALLADGASTPLEEMVQLALDASVREGVPLAGV